MTDVLYIDSETEAFRVGNKAPEIVCLAYARPDGERGLMRHEDVDAFLGPALEQAIEGRWVIAGHHISYDMKCVIAHKPRLAKLVWRAYQEGRISCTEKREELIDIADDKLKGSFNPDTGKFEKRRYNLADMTRRLRGITINKGADTWRTRYGELKNVPLELWPVEARTYPIGDVDHGLWLWLRQQEELRERFNGALPTEMLEVGADFAFELTSAWGIRTDAARVNALWKFTDKRIRELREILLDTGLLVSKIPRNQMKLFGPDSRAAFDDVVSQDTKWLRQRIEQIWDEALGELPTTEKTGAVKTGKEVLELFPDEPGFDELIDFNALRKTGSTYVRKLFEGIEWPIHANFHSLGARSTRASSSGPNMQNQPRLPGVRECFTAREGRSYVASDYKTQEMRTLAQVCLDVLGYSTLAKRFQEDPDFDAHLELAANHILHVPVEKAKEMLAYESKHGEGAASDARQRAKAANFGLPGGMGVPGLIRYAKGYGVKLNVGGAQELIKAYRAERHEMGEYFEWVRGVVNGNANYGTAVIPRSGFRRGGCAFTDACNTYFQTPAAHSTKAALFEACRRMYSVETSALYGARPVNCVHDEIMVEAFEGYEHETALELEHVMCEEMQPFVPDLPVAAEAVAMKHWSKKAKRIIKDGRLQVWDAPFPIKDAA